MENRHFYLFFHHLILPTSSLNTASWPASNHQMPFPTRFIRSLGAPYVLLAAAAVGFYPVRWTMYVDCFFLLLLLSSFSFFCVEMMTNWFIHIKDVLIMMNSDWMYPVKQHCSRCQSCPPPPPPAPHRAPRGDDAGAGADRAVRGFYGDVVD